MFVMCLYACPCSCVAAKVSFTTATAATKVHAYDHAYGSDQCNERSWYIGVLANDLLSDTQQTEVQTSVQKSVDDILALNIELQTNSSQLDPQSISSVPSNGSKLSSSTEGDVDVKSNATTKNNDTKCGVTKFSKPIISNSDSIDGNKECSVKSWYMRVLKDNLFSDMQHSDEKRNVQAKVDDIPTSNEIELPMNTSELDSRSKQLESWQQQKLANQSNNSTVSGRSKATVPHQTRDDNDWLSSVRGCSFSPNRSRTVCCFVAMCQRVCLQNVLHNDDDARLLPTKQRSATEMSADNLGSKEHLDTELRAGSKKLDNTTSRLSSQRTPATPFNIYAYVRDICPSAAKVTNASSTLGATNDTRKSPTSKKDERAQATETTVWQVEVTTTDRNTTSFNATTRKPAGSADHVNSNNLEHHIGDVSPNGSNSIDNSTKLAVMVSNATTENNETGRVAIEFPKVNISNSESITGNEECSVKSWYMGVLTDNLFEIQQAGENTCVHIQPSDINSQLPTDTSELVSQNIGSVSSNGSNLINSTKLVAVGVKSNATNGNNDTAPGVAQFSKFNISNSDFIAGNEQCSVRSWYIRVLIKDISDIEQSEEKRSVHTSVDNILTPDIELQLNTSQPNPQRSVSSNGSKLDNATKVEAVDTKANATVKNNDTKHEVAAFSKANIPNNAFVPRNDECNRISWYMDLLTDNHHSDIQQSEEKTNVQTKVDNIELPMNTCELGSHSKQLESWQQQKLANQSDNSTVSGRSVATAPHQTHDDNDRLSSVRGCSFSQNRSRTVCYFVAMCHRVCLKNVSHQDRIDTRQRLVNVSVDKLGTTEPDGMEKEVDTLVTLKSDKISMPFKADAGVTSDVRGVKIVTAAATVAEVSNASTATNMTRKLSRTDEGEHVKVTNTTVERLKVTTNKKKSTSGNSNASTARAVNKTTTPTEMDFRRSSSFTPNSLEHYIDSIFSERKLRNSVKPVVYLLSNVCITNISKEREVAKNPQFGRPTSKADFVAGHHKCKRRSWNMGLVAENLFSDTHDKAKKTNANEIYASKMIDSHVSMNSSEANSNWREYELKNELSSLTMSDRSPLTATYLSSRSKINNAKSDSVDDLSYLPFQTDAAPSRLTTKENVIEDRNETELINDNGLLYSTMDSAKDRHHQKDDVREEATMNMTVVEDDKAAGRRRSRDSTDDVYEQKLQLLEIKLLRLENQFLQSTLARVADTTATDELRHDAVRMRRKLVRLNRSVVQLRTENQKLRRRNVHITATSEHDRSVDQQRKVAELTESVNNQSNLLTALQDKLTDLERDKRLLVERLINQSLTMNEMMLHIQTLGTDTKTTVEVKTNLMRVEHEMARLNQSVDELKRENDQLQQMRLEAGTGDNAIEQQRKVVDLSDLIRNNSDNLTALNENWIRLEHENRLHVERILNQSLVTNGVLLHVQALSTEQAKHSLQLEELKQRLADTAKSSTSSLDHQHSPLNYATFSDPAVYERYDANTPKGIDSCICPTPIHTYKCIRTNTWCDKNIA